MAKKRKADQEQIGSIFDHFAKMGRPMGEPEVKSAPVDVQTLLARIEAQDKQLNELKAARTPEYPMAAPNQQQQQQQHIVDPAKLRVNLDGLPNRLDDPEGYDREYTIRVNAAMAAQTEAVQRQLTAKFERERASERLWSGFKTAHPEWAPYESLVETVANRVTMDLTAKGVDLQRYMLGSPDKFYEDIAGALKQQYGKLVEKANDEEDDEDVEDESEADPSDSSRVQGLGSDGTPAAKGKRSVGQERQPDMFDDLRAIQKRMGII